MFLKTAMAAIVLSSPLAATEALAYKVKEMKFHFVEGPYENLPVMEMKFENGAWNWVNQSSKFTARLKVFFRASRKSGATVKLKGFGNIWTTPLKYRTKKYEKLDSISIGRSILNRYKSDAVAACERSGGPRKVVRDMPIQATMNVYNDYAGGGAKDKHGYFPTKVVCHAKRRTGNTPTADSSGGHYTAKLQLKKLKLYTVPGKPTCGKPVKLVAEFHTNRAGKVDFMLYRGDGEMQKASVTTTKGGRGYVKRWSKTYTLKSSTNRKYMIASHEHHKSTKWLPLKVNCSGGATTLSN